MQPAGCDMQASSWAYDKWIIKCSIRRLNPFARFCFLKNGFGPVAGFEMIEQHENKLEKFHYNNAHNNSTWFGIAFESGTQRHCYKVSTVFRMFLCHPLTVQGEAHHNPRYGFNITIGTFLDCKRRRGTGTSEIRYRLVFLVLILKLTLINS